ncbi:MAG: nuclear transport factor 2 family protein [Actinomycetota bacterium]
MSPPHEAVRNLLGRYCELLDRGDLEGVADLFAEAVLTDDDGREVARGREGTLRLLRGTLHLHGGSPRTRHLTTNSIIDVDEEAGTATARSAYVVLQATDTLALQPIIAGRYRDRFARRADGEGWRFAERAFAIDLVGDLSHHMRYEVPPS